MAALSDDGRAVIERTIDTPSQRHENIDEWYEIDRTTEYIISGNFQRVALQFPDELLADSASVAKKLEERTSKRMFILADTSYGSCCVDEVAAEHVNADLIVHYGHSCLSATSRITVLYVFGREPVNIDDCVQQCNEIIPDPSEPLIVMSNVEYNHAIEKITGQLLQNHHTVVSTQIRSDHKIVQDHARSPDSPDKSSSCQTSPCQQQACCRTKESGADLRSNEISEPMTDATHSGRSYILPSGLNMDDCSILFIGYESLALTNMMMVRNKCKVYTYNPRTLKCRQETAPVNRLLMRRYGLMLSAKDANTIGIVVGTLGVASYLNVIEHLKKLITSSGRKWYFFVMGKLNVAKMANFEEIECFVLVACPENSLIDSKEFYRPIVTPFELEIALIKSKEWTGDYITDFSRLLPSIRTDGFTYDEVQDDEEGDFSVLTGQYISRPFRNTSMKNDQERVITSKLTDLTLRSNDGGIIEALNSTAGRFLQQRTYKGLEVNAGQDEPAVVQEGKSGIARGYQSEK